MAQRMATSGTPTHLTLEIVTPDRSVVAEKVDEVEIPGAEGYFGVLPGHTPLLATLKVGELWYRKGARSSICRSRSGLPKCCPIASRSSPSSPSGPTRSTWRGPKRPSAAPKSGSRSRRADVDFERARLALMKSLVRLQVSTRARTRV